MAYKDFTDGFTANAPALTQMTLQANGSVVHLPDTAYIRDAQLQRDGMDLQLQTDNGSITIENYFAVETKPMLTGPDGSTLSPKLVSSFVKSGNQYADNGLYASDVSPVGTVAELSGQNTVTRTDGTTETIRMGTEIYQGDIIETAQDGAVNINFVDETSFAVSESARLSIDEYVYDPATESGQTDFSVLKGMFVYTSGLIGRDDPDDVTIDTPIGSIGIRGTIIAGDVDLGEITVVEGAIVLRDFGGNEVTLANQFETARFAADGNSIEGLGQLSAADVAGKFASVSNVSPTLFSSINDAAAEQSGNDNKAVNEGEGESEAGTESKEGDTQNQDAAPEADAKTNADDAGAEGADAEAKTAKDGEPKTETAGKDAEPKGENADNANETRVQDTSQSENAGKADAAEVGNQPPSINNTQRPDGLNASGRGQGNENGLNLSEAAKTSIESKNHNDTFRKFLNKNSPAEKEVKAEDSVAPNLTQQSVFTEIVERAATSETTNASPTLNNQINVAQTATLNGGTGFNWILDLGKLFADSDTPHSQLTFRMDGSSEAALNSIKGGEQILDNWNFNTDTGLLKLDLNQNITEIWDDLSAINITLRATDGNSYSDSISFTLDGKSESTYLDNNELLFVNNTSETIQLAGNNSIFYLNDSNNHIEIGYTPVGFGNPKPVALENSTIYTGDNDGTVTINSASAGNTIFGSDDASGESFNVHNIDNTIKAGGGSDTITLFWDESAVSGAGLDGSSQHVLDGGDNNQSWAQSYAEDQIIGDNINFGDALVFNSQNPSDPVNIDFNNILADTNIKNFEHLKVISNSNTTVDLTIDQVISMTDDSNTLIISYSNTSGTQDGLTINVDGFAHAYLNHDGETDVVDIGGKAYMAYVGTGTGNETVTLFVTSTAEPNNVV